MSDIIFERRGGLAVVTLNRPKALNALTHLMCQQLDAKLADWSSDDEVHAVLIKGEGDRAFCAGGDVLDVYERGNSGDTSHDFFRDEYRLNRRLFHIKKPYVALIDGIVMGGGCGVSINGPYRVATERTMFAMPETGIGLFPDVGGTYFLNRCPGKVGLYLGMTGARLKADDMVALGLATHKISSDQGQALEDRLAAQDWTVGAAHELVDQILEEFAAPLGDAPIMSMRDLIDRCFDAGSVGEITENLTVEGSDFARETLETLSGKAPASIMVAFRQLEEGRDLDFDAVMVREYRIVMACLAASDFYEGVRALLIDKDKTPKWQPASLDLVDEAVVARYFAEPPVGDLTFLD